MDKLVINKAFTQQNKLLDTDPNKKTLESYNRYAYEYIQKTTPTVEESPLEMREWIDQALKSLHRDDVIFEIGSAVPRDATYMRSKGFNVIRSDAAVSFVQIMRSQGEDAALFNVLEDKLVDQYPMIFANGVFPHFTEEEARDALRNIHSSLKTGGIFVFSTKQGEGEEWINEKFEDPRFAHYWSLAGIAHVLKEEGFLVEFNNFNTGDYPSHRWLNFICRKIED